MKLLFKGDMRAVQIVEKKKLRPNREYRLSLFVYPFETGGRVILCNTLTKKVVELDAGEWDAVRANAPDPKLRDELALAGFLAEKDYDELSQYAMVMSTLQALEKKSSGIRLYTILPTTACNARCVYCYEEGWTPVSMTPETAEAVIDFICRTKAEGDVHLRWFGGEPLLGASVISRICRGLRERGVGFYSSMITNASLLTAERMREITDLWNMKKVQISMDGARADYEARKRYVDPAGHNYDAAMKAAEMLSDAGIYVRFRCNYDAENLPRFGEFIRDCRGRFGGRKNVSAYLAQLFQSAGVQETDDLYRAAAETELSMAEAGLSPGSHLNGKLRTRYCMADSDPSSIVIGPSGDLHFCEHTSSEKPLGTVFDGILPVWPQPAAEPAESCRSCCFLPECTPFRKLRCPVTPERCFSEMSLETECEILDLLKKTDRNAFNPAVSEEEAEPADAEAAPGRDLC